MELLAKSLEPWQRRAMERERRAIEARQALASEITSAGGTATWLRLKAPKTLEKYPNLAELPAEDLASVAGNIQEVERVINICEACPGLEGCQQPRHHHGYTAILEFERWGRDTLPQVSDAPCRHERERRQKERADHLLGEAGFPKRYAGAELDALQGAGLKKAWEYVEHFNERAAEGRGLLLLGGVGTGKTTLAVAAAKEIIRKHLRAVRFVAVPDLLQEVRAAFGKGDDGAERLRDAVREAPVLLLDDLGAEKVTDWVREELYCLVDHRYRELLPTIITTNCTLDELEERLGERTASRIIEESDAVLLDGADRRKARKGVGR